MTADPAAPKSTRTVDEILTAASDESRAALKVLGELVGNEPASVATPAQFATRHLGIDPLALASTRFTGPSTSLAILGNMLRLEIAKHGDAVIIGSPGDGLPPTWSQLDLGLDEHGVNTQVTVPGRLVAFFPQARSPRRGSAFSSTIATGRASLPSSPRMPTRGSPRGSLPRSGSGSSRATILSAAASSRRASTTAASGWALARRSIAGARG